MARRLDSENRIVVFIADNEVEMGFERETVQNGADALPSIAITSASRILT